jgi:nicotinamide mononucleotide transporter PnuC
MVKFFKKTFKGWTWFEYLILVIAVFVMPILGMAFRASPFEMAFAVGASITSLLFAKGKMAGYFLCLFVMAAEVVVAWSVHLYSSVLLIFFIAYPTVVYGIFNWARNKRNDKAKGRVVRISRVTKQELLLIAFLAPFVWTGLFFLLDAFGTRSLALATTVTVVGIAANYLLARRSKICMLLFMICDIIGILIWTSLLVEGHTGAVVIIALCVMYLITDIHGLREWGKLKTRQCAPDSQLLNVDGAECGCCESEQVVSDGSRPVLIKEKITK